MKSDILSFKALKTTSGTHRRPRVGLNIAQLDSCNFSQEVADLYSERGDLARGVGPAVCLHLPPLDEKWNDWFFFLTRATESRPACKGAL